MSSPKQDNNSDHRRLTLGDVHMRLQGHVYTLYINFAFFVKGAIVAVAGLVILLILTRADVTYRAQREVLWAATFMFSLVTLATWSRGAIFTNWHANAFDIILPIVVGTCEVLLYFVLSPTTASSPLAWRWWYLIFAIFSLFASALVLNRLVQARGKEFELNPALIRGVREYRSWLWSDMIGSFFLGIGSLSMFWFPKWFAAQLAPYNIDSDIAVGSLLTVIGGLVVFQTARHYRTLASL